MIWLFGLTTLTTYVFVDSLKHLFLNSNENAAMFSCTHVRIKYV